MANLPETGAGRKWCVVSLPHWVYRTHGRAYKTEKQWWTGGGNFRWSTEVCFCFDTRAQAKEAMRLIGEFDGHPVLEHLRVEEAPKW